MNNSGIESLGGLEGLDIEKIELSRLKKLTSLKGLEGTKNSLKTLVIESCSKFDSLGVLRELSSLEKLGINDCKEIKSLAPIKDLNKLNYLDFWGNTKILDGDMTPCLGIDKVAYENRKHYNYTNEEIDRLNQKQ
jgi:Leucine-rich repeat (LRR) protein